MSDIVVSGKALYWGTSEWSADEIRDRDRGRRAAPPPQAGHGAAAVQPARTASGSRSSTRRLFDEFGYGATTWSPLASGLLTGKYRDGVPADSRGALRRLRLARQADHRPGGLAKVEKLRPIADELGCTLAQLALAWCTKNPNVSTVITGASKPSQVVENFAALDVIPALTPEVLDRIDAARRRRSRTLDSLHAVRTSDDKLPIQMLNDRLLVRIPDADGERRSQGGILIPATAQMAKRLVWAEVVALGQNVRSAEVGDLVLFSPGGPLRGRGAGQRLHHAARARHPCRGFRTHRSVHGPLPVNGDAIDLGGDQVRRPTASCRRSPRTPTPATC